MKVSVCTYNVEWFDYLFDNQNQVISFQPQNSQNKKLKKQFDGLGTVFQTVDADIYGIVEAPNTTVTTGNQSTVTKLNNFLQHFNLNKYDVITGYISPGSQELALIYDKNKFNVNHFKGGSNTKKNPPFDNTFEFDSEGDGINEIYKFYRPPLEAEITEIQSGKKFYIILVHTKSKGIFSAVDMVRWEKENRKNRRKLFAECSWIRRRVDDWLDKNRNIIVMGDINDGPGMDYYEAQFGRSAVEILMGDIFEPDRILRNYCGRPKWGRYGWEPSSTRFKDRITETNVNALIDHILMTSGLNYSNGSHKIWNPYYLNEAKPIKTSLLDASDHFPVSVEITL
jgi:endonuclease/exonuclease/phosphatase family metal-dependent hydrolase